MIDAICINQTSNDERNHQVAQTADIYARASEVLIWLGEGDRDTKEAMKYITKSADNLSKSARRCKRGINVKMRALFSLPWWSRVWEIQEVAVATSDSIVLCGNLKAPWTAISLALEAVNWCDSDHQGSTISCNFDCEKRDKDISEKYRRKPCSSCHSGQCHNTLRLADLLRSTLHYEATDPRDRVFALLGLIGPNTTRFSQINDSKSESLIFEDATVNLWSNDDSGPTRISRIDCSKSESLVYQDATVDLLMNAGFNWLVQAAYSGDPTLPSWCVDFSSSRWRPTHLDFALGKDFFDNITWAEVPPRRSFVYLHDNIVGPTLCVPEMQVDVIKRVHMFSKRGLKEWEVRPAYAGGIEALCSRNLQGVVQLLSDMSLCRLYVREAFEARQTPEEAAVRLRNGDHWKLVSHGCRAPDMGDEVCLAADEYRAIESFANVGDEIWTSHELSQSDPAKDLRTHLLVLRCLTDIAYQTSDRYFFTTDTGFVGTAGHLVKEGDTICMFSGCPHPMAMRPQRDGTVKVVTWAYIHDLMHGKLFEEPGSWKEEIINIS